MIEYYDTHSHLNDASYSKGDIKDAIKNLKEYNTFTNCVAFDFDSSIMAINFAKLYPQFFRACVGVHPNDVYKYFNDKDFFKKFDELVKNNRKHIVAIGEIGLDSHYGDEFKKEQIEYCHKFIEIGMQYNLPIMFHIRDCFEDIKPIIQAYPNAKKIIHCFGNGIEEAEFYLKHNCVLSISGVVTFKNAKPLHNAIKLIDLNNVMVETDAPYLTPVPFRGEKNFPHYVQYSVKEIAKLKMMDEQDVKKIVLNNAKKVFDIEL
ncbi:MAG: TatD family hydrolase [Malacoplasma sp.]|nr:TatD family hydrolase [Malacoplasma sp.]